MKLRLIAFLAISGLVSSAAAGLPPGWNPKEAGDGVLSRLVKITAPQVKGAHDASMALVAGRAYVVAEVNDRRAGEAAGWPEIYVALSIVNTKSLQVERIIPVARGGQSFKTETLPEGACFVPRILQLSSKVMRVYFASEAPGKRQAQTYFVDFDLASGAFEKSIHRAKLKTAAGTFDMQPRYLHADAAAQGFTRPAVDYGLYLFDHFKFLDGRLCVALNNYPGGQNALALVNDQRDTFAVIGHYNQPPEFRLTESAVNRLPDGTWMAICRREDGDRNYTFTTSRDGRTWTPNEPRSFVPNGAASKPTFDKFGDVYYLGWQEKTTINGVGRSVFNLDVSVNGLEWERKYRFETEQSFQYPCFVEHGGSIWLCVTQGDSDPSRKERIMFGRLE